MKTKTLKNIIVMTCGILGVLCFFWIAGSAGSLEQNKITTTQFWVQTILGFAGIFVDYCIYKVAEYFIGSFDECFEEDDYYIDEE
jgi:hypothetical protein